MALAKNIETKMLNYLSHLSEKNQQVALSLVKTLVKEEEKTQKHELSDEQYAELDRRWLNYKNGKSKAYSWDEVKERLQKKLSKGTGKK